uniref:Uncharacterized protein n=1 Tax=bacterium symbiont of Plakortis simplex pPS11G3 TaxID=1256902 RepID=V5JAF2_UNCXX|nr:hypothetical protein [bacterium symbiont of Plakortis simplex pPS11G3]
MTNHEEKTITIRSAVDLNIVGENILDIAAFAIEKYQFQHDTEISPEGREEAARRIRDALWERVKEMRAKRQQWLHLMFETADRVVKEFVEES